MTKKIESVLADMYGITVDEVQELVPFEVIDELEKVNELCRRASGELVSRQIIAEIVVRVDTRKIYNGDKNGSL